MTRIINILTKNWFLVLIIIVGFLLRVYRFPEYVQFLADQGRDAIILKRIVTLEHFPAIGPPTSLGQIYLGPFYYYFIAPWLLIFNFNPLGPAIGVLFFSTIFLIINYLIIKELIDKKTALFSTILISFSYILIEFSRFSWNPNLLPFFTLLTVYFFIKSLKTHQWHFYLLTGSFLSFVIQLHYLALFLIPSITSIYLFKFKINNLKKYLLAIFGFIFFSLPLLIFDLRHQFLNSKNFIKFFTETRTEQTNYLNNFFESFKFLNQYLFNINFNFWLLLIILILLITSLIFIFNSRNNVKFFILIFLTSLFFYSFYNGPKHSHYFGILFPLYAVIISYFISFITNSLLEKFLAMIFISFFIFFNFQKYNFLFYKGNNQIENSKKIAQIIYKNVKVKKYVLTSLPERFSETQYRYFLEIWNKKPLEKDSLEKGDELYVICEDSCKQIINNSQWDIAYFQPSRIVKSWQINNVKIYKLLR